MVTSAELLHRITALLERAGGALLRDRFGVSYSRALLLRVVATHPGISQGELATQLGYTAPAVSALLKEVERAGLVTVRQKDANRRMNVVSLTTAGAVLTADISTTLEGRFEQVLRVAVVDESELVATLGRIEDALNRKEGSGNG